MVNFSTGNFPYDLDCSHIDCDKGRKSGANKMWKNFKASTKQKRSINRYSYPAWMLDEFFYMIGKIMYMCDLKVSVCANLVDGPFDTRQADDKIELINDVTV